MSELIEFSGDYSDQSTDRGFQFEFKCGRCHCGVRTQFQSSAIGTVASVLDSASSLLGGLFGKAAELGHQVKSASWKKAHDDAFQAALQEMKPSFIQCPRCQTWVCRNSCWNNGKGLCKGCAPDLGVEMAAAQANRSVEEIHAHAKMAEEEKALLKEENWRKGVKASCPKCEKPFEGQPKFCPECGFALGGDPKCAKCGTKLTPKAKFCPECGEKTAG